MNSETPVAEDSVAEIQDVEVLEAEAAAAVEPDAAEIDAAVLEADEAADADEDDEIADDDGGAADDIAEMDASDFDNLRLVEALLFASAEPLAPAQLARFLPEDCKVEPLLADLETLYANRGVNLVKRGGRWAFRTAPDLSPRMELENKVVRKLSRVALETLAVIAYHQPVTRAEIEEIRGVALSKGTLDALLEIGWIRPKGRRKTPGRPVTWGTSDSFLDHFGLDSLDALPGVEELKAAGLLDARPALTALSDRGLLPAAGEVSPERIDDDEEDADGEDMDASTEELLEETFGENLLPHEVDLAAAGGAAEAEGEATPEAEDEGEGAPDEAEPDEAETEMFGGAEDFGAEDFAANPGAEDGDEDFEDDDLDDEIDLAADDFEGDGDLDDDDDDEDEDDFDEDEDLDDDVRHRRHRSAG